jgi:cell division initiation protein
MTPDDIREKTFDKAVFGGYDIGSVDDFMDQMADSLESTQKEIKILRAKMKVLVNKIEEYRASEALVTSTLISAQKTAVQIETTARDKANAIVADARRQAEAIVGGIEDRRKEEEEKLEQTKRAAEEYMESIRALCANQLSQISDFEEVETAEEVADEKKQAAAPEPAPAEASRIPQQADLEASAPAASAPTSQPAETNTESGETRFYSL